MQHTGHGERADGERQHPRVEVRLERIDAGARDAMPERDDCRQRNRAPRTGEQLVADEQQRQPEQRDGQEIASDEHGVERGAGRPDDRGRDSVADVVDEDLAVRHRAEEVAHDPRPDDPGADHGRDGPVATRHGSRRPAWIRMEVRMTHRLALAAAAEHRPPNLCAGSLARSGPAQWPKISMNSFVMKKSAARTITDPRTTAWVVDRPTPSVPPVVVRPL